MRRAVPARERPIFVWGRGRATWERETASAVGRRVVAWGGFTREVMGGERDEWKDLLRGDAGGGRGAVGGVLRAGEGVEAPAEGEGVVVGVEGNAAGRRGGEDERVLELGVGDLEGGVDGGVAGGPAGDLVEDGGPVVHVAVAEEPDLVGVELGGGGEDGAGAAGAVRGLAVEQVEGRALIGGGGGGEGGGIAG